MAAKTKKAYIFDMDGTLIDSMPMLERLDLKIFESLGLTMTEAAADVLRYIPFSDAAVYIVDTFLPGRSYREIETMLLNTVAEEYKKVETLPYVIDFLKKAKAEGIPMCIATATDTDIAIPVAERCGLMEYMEFLVSCDEVGANKDKPDVFLEAARRLGVEPSEATVFEDGMPGATSSKVAGFNVVGVYDSFVPPKEAEVLRMVSDRYIMSFNDIMQDMP